MSKVWNDLMNSDFGRKVIAEIDKKSETNKQAQDAAYSVNMDRDKLYDVGWHENYLSPSTDTQGVSGGGGSNVGSGDRNHLYTTQSAPVPGGAEQGADATIEGKEDIAKKMMDVAQKAPTGNPQGTQDNNPENWDGLQAAGSDVKQFTKKAQDREPMWEQLLRPESERPAAQEEDEGQGIEELLALLEQGSDQEKAEDEMKMLEESEQSEGSEEDVFDAESMMQSEASNQTEEDKTVGFIGELVDIADSLDSDGKHNEAAEIDAVIRAEVQALRKKVRG